MAASYQVTPPEQFVFSHAQEWPKWIRRFERFRSAAGLETKAEEVQVNTLMYTMGDGADDILRSSFGLSKEDKKKYGTVKGKFDSHFVKRRNIFERAKFNMRIQGENEPVDAFITELYALAEHCGYADLHDEMIRDRIVVGLRDAPLSEKLQLDGALTLDKAVSTEHQAEAVKEQQAALRTDGTKTHIGSVNKTKQTKQWPTRQPNSPGGKPCFWCGTIPYHSQQL